MASERRVIIERDADGATFGVLPEAFEAGAADRYAGHRILHWEGGEPYEGAKTAQGVERKQKASQSNGRKRKATAPDSNGKDADGKDAGGEGGDDVADKTDGGEAGDEA